MRNWIAALAAIILAVAMVALIRFITGMNGNPAGSPAPNSDTVHDPDQASDAGSAAMPVATRNAAVPNSGSVNSSAPGKTAMVTNHFVGDKATAIQSPTGTPLEFTNLPAATVVDNMRVVMHSYASMFGANPVGNNEEIASTLDGGNPRQANFINAEAGMRLNAKGELIDPWGTPYFFHQLSAQEMEIHSAGPDKKMWTDDDLVVR